MRGECEVEGGGEEIRARRDDGECEVREKSGRRQVGVMSGREACPGPSCRRDGERDANAVRSVGGVRSASPLAAPRVHRARTRESAMALGQACGRRHAVRARQGWQDREASRTR